MNSIIIMTILGLFLFFYGLYNIFSHVYKVNNYKKIVGHFTDYTIIRPYARTIFSKKYFPIVSYEVSGKIYKKRFNRAFLDDFSAINCIGQSVIVFYNEKDPFDATFLVDKSYICVIIGILLLIFPGIIFISMFLH